MLGESWFPKIVEMVENWSLKSARKAIGKRERLIENVVWSRIIKGLLSYEYY